MFLFYDALESTKHFVLYTVPLGSWNTNNTVDALQCKLGVREYIRLRRKLSQNLQLRQSEGH